MDPTITSTCGTTNGDRGMAVLFDLVLNHAYTRSRVVLRDGSHGRNGTAEYSSAMEQQLADRGYL